MRSTKDTAVIVVPALVTSGDAATQDLIRRLVGFTDLGHVIVVNQGERIEIEAAGIEIHHFEKPLGNWGAMLEGWKATLPLIEQRANAVVIHNMAPLYFQVEDMEAIIREMRDHAAPHTVGVREDIAGSLAPNDPTIGKVRALIECFLTTLAGVHLGTPGFTDDGFTGLQGFTGNRYRGFDWEWLTATTWGGSLEDQVQSVLRRDHIRSSRVPHRGPRTHPTTLGTNLTNIANGIFGQARRLPIFTNTSRNSVEQALRQVGLLFRSQPWCRPETAAEEIRQLLIAYNAVSEIPFPGIGVTR